MAERVTVMMWRVFRCVGPSELFDGAWQVGWARRRVVFYFVVIFF